MTYINHHFKFAQVRLRSRNKKNRIWNIKFSRKSKNLPIFDNLLIQKSKGSSAFDEQKVKNITIEYRLKLNFCNPEYFAACNSSTTTMCV